MREAPTSISGIRDTIRFYTYFGSLLETNILPIKLMDKNNRKNLQKKLRVDERHLKVEKWDACQLLDEASLTLRLMKLSSNKTWENLMLSIVLPICPQIQRQSSSLKNYALNHTCYGW